MICVENANAQRRTSNRTANPMLASEYGCGREPFDATLLELNRNIAGRNLRPIRVHGSASLFGPSDALRKTGPRCGPLQTGRRADPTGTKTSSSRSRRGCGTTFLSQLGVNRGFYNVRSIRSRRNWLNSSSYIGVRTLMIWD